MRKIGGEKRKQRERSLFADISYDFSSYEVFSLEFNVMLTNSYLNDSNCTMDSTKAVPVNNNIPLRVLIRRMLDEAFGETNRMINVTGDRSNLENKSCEVDTSLISLKNESIISHDGMKDCSSLHESVLNCTNRKNNKLITIEEERTNSSNHSDSIEYTGTYLNGLPSYDNKIDDSIKHNNPLPSQNNTKIFASQIDADISSNNSLSQTNFEKDESSICEQTDDSNKSVMIISTIHSFDDIDISSNDENTANFLNTSKKESSPETKEVSCEIESLVDASLLHDCSVKDKPTFISTLTLRRRTPKSSINTNGKLFKTPCFNVSLIKKQAQHKSSFYMVTANTLETSNTIKPLKTAKVYTKRAKLFKSRGAPKQRQMAPQIILTPATPKLISS